MIPCREDIETSLSKESKIAAPFTLIQFPTFRDPRSSSAIEVGTKSLQKIESVKSVIENLTIVLSFLIFLLLFEMIFPRTTTSPISPTTSLIGIASSPTSLP